MAACINRSAHWRCTPSLRRSAAIAFAAAAIELMDASGCTARMVSAEAECSAVQEAAQCLLSAQEPPLTASVVAVLLADRGKSEGMNRR